ncbi:MAG: hypothetical protein R3E39_12165 [Anaerolineae bacterium]
MNDPGVILGWAIIGGLALGIGFLMWRGIRRFRIRQKLHKYLIQKQKTETGLVIFEEWNNAFQVDVINGKRLIAGKGVFTLAPGQFSIYPLNGSLDPLFTLSLDHLRWFGRPVKYHDGMNDIWLHVETEQGWLLLKLIMHRYVMQDFVRTIKPLTTPELVTAYRRRRPYVHAGPLPAQPASQDIHGAWTLGEAVTLYLMPRHLIIMDGSRVMRKLELEDIQDIKALRRLDAPQADGLLRFRAEEADFAFAIKEHEAFAKSLAEAARSTLEASLEQKRKGKAYDEDYEYDDDVDMEDFEDEVPPQSSKRTT